MIDMEITGKDMGVTYKEDWIYRDMPNMTEEYFDKYVAMIGEENISWLTMARRTWADGTVTARGQHLISPQGVANVRKYLSEINE